MKIRTLGLILLPVSCCAWMYATFANPLGELDYLEGVVLQDPEQKARAYIAEEDFKSAQEFIEFYRDLPGAEVTPALERTRAEAEKARESWWYRTKELSQGFFLGESHEDYALYAGLVSDLTVLGDIRDLGKAGYDFATDREVDAFTASLAGIGLTLAAVPMAKGCLALFKAARRANVLSKKFQKSLLALKDVGKATEAMKDGMKSLVAFHSAHGTRATFEMLRRCDDVRDIPRMTRTASKLGGDAGKYLRFCGPTVLDIVEKQGPEVVRHGAAYGEDALRRLERKPGRLLSRDIPLFRALQKGVRKVGGVMDTLLSSILKVLGSTFTLVASLLCVLTGLLPDRRKTK